MTLSLARHMGEPPTFKDEAHERLIDACFHRMVELPTSRKVALDCGAAFYCTGVPCARGHVSRRWSQCGGCVECRTARRRKLGMQERQVRPPISAGEATCGTCGQQKKAQEFRVRDGKLTKCRECFLVYQRSWKKRNRAKLNASNQRYRKANAGIYRAASRVWAKNNKEARRVNQANRKARILRAGGRLSKLEIGRLHELQRGRCAACRTTLHQYHVDHIVALARGGSNDKGNVQLLCPPCNMSKHTKDFTTFMQERGFLL